MESMNDKKFDSTLKEKIASFEANVPAGLWENIKEELDAEKAVGPTLIEKDAPIVIAKKINGNNGARSVKRIVMLFGSIAALLFITFFFLRNDNSEIIYLQPMAKSQRVAIPAEKQDDISENTIPLIQEVDDAKNTLESVTVNVVKEKHFEKTQSIQKSSPTASEVNNNEEFQVVKEEKIDHAIALVPVEIVIEIKEPLAVTNTLPVLALQEISIQQNSQESALEGNIGELHSRKIGLSTVLNFLTKGLISEREIPIEFSETEEGILKWDIKSSLARNRK